VLVENCICGIERLHEQLVQPGPGKAFKAIEAYKSYLHVCMTLLIIEQKWFVKLILIILLKCLVIQNLESVWWC